MKKKNIILVIFIISIALLLSYCRKSENPDFFVYRFFDEIEKENIIISPLKSRHEQSASERNAIADEFEDNPYLVKRKLKLGGTWLNVLYAPPKTLFKFKVKIPKKSILEFGYGLLNSNNSPPIKFEILIEYENKKIGLFKRLLTREAGDEVFFRRIDLSHYSGKKANLYFLTNSKGKTFSFWYNPVIYTPSDNYKNVILISVDTLRADHLGCYGYKRNTSPNIDKLAEEGVLFLNSFAPSPWTLPSHISLMTSLNNFNHGVYYEDQKLKTSILTLAQILRNNGYFCSAFTGGGLVSGIYGFYRGFDSYREDVGAVFHRDSAERVYKAVYYWLNSNKDKKFFLFLHTYQPHDPYFSPYPYNMTYLSENAKWRYINLKGYLGGNSGIYKSLLPEERQNIIDLYDGEIKYVDDCLIKPLINILKKFNLYDRTLIIFMSDHGEEFFEHGGWEHGHALYNESIKVPLIIKFPFSKFKGKRIKKIARLIDIMPTILDELGLEYPEKKIDGKSLISLIQGREKGERQFVCEVGKNILELRNPRRISINKGIHKIILSEEYEPEDLNFYIYPPPNMERVEIFNLETDVMEKNNLAKKNARLLDELLKELRSVYLLKAPGDVEKIKIGEDLKKQLKALGYIN
ncbi:sulfatase [Candidatus Aminicenantes bacterium AC-335-K20]|jgi:arylsulfatase A-like enzyme|nr:sulfatase [SCandidatus Aminicenantes bacterium Aminicenantia_JdfR_composite]MCP2597001.1 sulfatase [Candidatus Aminicenantes bacterium AC-335-G13]MCP2606043.1 sulfatase [Candidatus Aminicenantes bacterium AC-708-I09]MCP2618402.1 sulfatase [Candidatus Aminicenantes bacterium AC-335-A11]MCP2619398.1 sulfatase [Candidatus Aminicenantes bacterium AC-335-K20]MCP2620607.1 sulfatase [Candidatus Aminicenantes bacterium AC-334-E05]